MMISKFDRALNSFNFPADLRSHTARVTRRGVSLLSIALLATALHSGPAYAAENDAVRVRNERAVTTLTAGPTAPTPGVQFAPPVAFIHLAIVQGAVYDGVNAIKGGHDPYLKGLKAPTSASRGAAAATAAHHVLIGLVNQAPLTATLTASVKSAIKTRLDAEYASSLAEIPDGPAKAKGIEVGAAAAAAMLANRAGDGRFGAPGFPVPAEFGPGDWRPSPGNDPNAWVRNVRPFALPRPEYFHTSGPVCDRIQRGESVGPGQRIYADRSSDYASKLVDHASGCDAVSRPAAGCGFEGADDHGTGAVPRNDQHVGGGQPNQLLGGKRPTGASGVRRRRFSSRIPTAMTRRRRRPAGPRSELCRRTRTNRPGPTASTAG
jgi:hypothetical protein